MAVALEADAPEVIRQLCKEHSLDLEAINRSLLQVLRGLPVGAPARAG